MPNNCCRRVNNKTIEVGQKRERFSLLNRVLCAMEVPLKFFPILICIVFLQSCATTNSESLAGLNGCWEFNTQKVADVSNSLSLCINSNTASMKIYYPNKGDVPTSCFNKGLVRKNENATILVALESGQCENGRESASSNIICGTEEPFLRCTFVGGGPLMEFNRKSA